MSGWFECARCGKRFHQQLRENDAVYDTCGECRRGVVGSALEAGRAGESLRVDLETPAAAAEKILHEVAVGGSDVLSLLPDEVDEHDHLPYLDADVRRSGTLPLKPVTKPTGMDC